jgi:hypothetical protein
VVDGTNTGNNTPQSPWLRMMQISPDRDHQEWPRPMVLAGAKHSGGNITVNAGTPWLAAARL